MSNRKKLGIIGGMGPDATVCMFQKIVKMTSACKDQEHIEIFIHNNTNIPDRTRSILYGGKSAINELLRSALILEKMGADVLIVSCMTAHYYMVDIQEAVDIPVINAIEQTVVAITQGYPEARNIGILATTGTVKASLFQKSLDKYRLAPIVLPDDFQENLIMSAIYGEKGIKAGFLSDDVRMKLRKGANYLIEHGAELIIAGCTEIPLALVQDDLHVPLLDPMDILAETAIQWCLK